MIWKGASTSSLCTWAPALGSQARYPIPRLGFRLQEDAQVPAERMGKQDLQKESRRFMDAGRHPHRRGALIPAGNDFKNTAETRIIEKKCDKK